MAWTDLTFAFGSILTSTKMTQLFDNLTAMANGNSGAPGITTAAIRDAEAGASIVISADTERTTLSATYVKLKEIRISKGGVLTIEFDLRNDFVTAFGRIYVNGVATGTERSQGTSYATYSEDILGLADGDLVQLYARTSSSAYNTRIRNFRFKELYPLEYQLITD